MSVLLPPNNRKRACMRCEWWKPLNSMSGKCKKNPPVHIGEDGYGYWPATGRSDWCGEFVTSRQHGTEQEPDAKIETKQAKSTTTT